MKYMQRFTPLREEAPAEAGGSLLTTPAATTWRDSLPDDLKSHPSIQDYKDITGLTKSYVEQQKMLGVDKIPAPNDKWGDKEWGEHFNRLGRPESPDKYTIPKTEGGPGEDDIKEMLQNLYDAGMTDSQAQKIMGKAFESYSQKESKERESRAAGIEAMKAELGDKFQETVDRAVAAVSAFGDDDTLKYLEESGLGDSPYLIKLLAKAGEALQDDGGRGINPGSFGGRFDTTDPNVQLKAHMQDPNFVKALEVEGHPDHDWAVQTRIQLLKKMDPSTIAWV